MPNNNSTLHGYFSSLAKHIASTAKFNSDTNEWLSSSTAADLFFEDAGNRIFLETLGIRDQLSTAQKILTIIKEIADSSKLYVNKLASLSIVLQELIKSVDSND